LFPLFAFDNPTVSLDVTHILASALPAFHDQGPDYIKYICMCSMIEIYNETIFDLLNPSQAQCLIREDIKNGVHLEGQAEEQVFSGAGQSLHDFCYR